ncbi:hypothetical protein BN7_2824 [Wickerhamomyces ciferrii]|uniref:Uncharacterized protein n=1 Tax=Wickerhamomyces ciferrii (strain ATCC 14091 / BCRC 22168 / CBS 111 / JCM 3599 / NBRC 0793 / NRRL Y-1031 F-60-10) TaxID=1206466 RepID=K0KK42_WICCF|nr:uncharacterized protein BN7_2824 [Wickerhamomyces ciferrii]CCH43276.1 hypothetical protein BN7_2824 [Wickerhamomyces ciferrii]
MGITLEQLLKLNDEDEFIAEKARQYEELAREEHKAKNPTSTVIIQNYEQSNQDLWPTLGGATAASNEDASDIKHSKPTWCRPTKPKQQQQESKESEETSKS